MDNTKEQRLNIELKEDIAQGIYANLVVISHSNSEFVIDYIRVLPGMPKGQVKSRIIMTPQNAKRLLLALQENITRFETANGKINDGNPNDNNLDVQQMEFSGPMTEA